MILMQRRTIIFCYTCFRIKLGEIAANAAYLVTSDTKLYYVRKLSTMNEISYISITCRLVEWKRYTVMEQEIAI